MLHPRVMADCVIKLVGCTKGGVGKTSIATNVAAMEASFFGARRVMLVDADKQLHASRWIARRLHHPRVPRVDTCILRGSLTDPVRTLAERYDVIVIDAGGADSQELRTALTIAHKALVPFAPSQFDLEGVEDMAQLVRAARDFNEDLVAMAVVNMMETHHARQHVAAQALAYLDDQTPLLRAENHICYRPSPFKASSSAGLACFEGKGAAAVRAADELAVVLDELNSWCWSDGGGDDDGGLPQNAAA